MRLVAVRKKNPIKPDDPQKYYMQATVSGEVSFETIARRIAKNTMCGRGDVLGVITSLVDEIIESLEEGNSVKMGDLGTMRVSVSSKGVEDSSQATVANVTKRRIVFIPGRVIKDRIGRMTFRQSSAASGSAADGGVGEAGAGSPEEI